MNEQAFHAAYNASRNGCNHYVQHPLVKSFLFTDGMHELADAGCFWMLDIFATELPPILRRDEDNWHGYISVTVPGDGTCSMKFERYDGDDANLWSKHIDWTDMPKGQYEFEIGFDGERVIACLLSEH